MKFLQLEVVRIFFFFVNFFLRKTVLGNKNQEQQISWTSEALAPCSCLVDKESRPFLTQHCTHAFLCQSGLDASDPHVSSAL